jgi:regulator of sigma E protease
VQNSYIQHYTLLSSLSYAYNSCVGMAQNNLTMLYYMLQGKVSWHNLGGPVSIAKASGAALHQGIKAFVDLMALISLSLAIMNLLPIPVLDGGHILLYTIELLRGRPIDLKTQQFLFTIGLILVLTFTSLALYNDFLKLFNL